MQAEFDSFLNFQFLQHIFLTFSYLNNCFKMGNTFLIKILKAKICVQLDLAHSFNFLSWNFKLKKIKVVQKYL